MKGQEQRYSNQKSNATFQPQTYRQSGVEQVNPGRAEMHSRSVSALPDAQQPLVGVIDQGFGAGEHGSEVLQTIAESNPQFPAWLGVGVGKGTWAKSLNDFVSTAKSLGKRAVANLSFDLTEKDSDGSMTTRSQLTTDEQQALSYAQENGVLIVASAGNQGGTMSALGQASTRYDNIIAVGAAEGDHRASYSSFGTGLDLVAPGREVGDTFVGTSRSAAAVTGTISQMWAANPMLDYRQVSRVLEATATDLQTPGWNAETGAGLLNPTAAVSLAEVITPDTQLFSGAQLLQQVNGSFNDAPWTSQNGAIASERTNRELEGESIQEDERLRANYRAKTQRHVPADFIGPVPAGTVRQPAKAAPQPMGKPVQRKPWQDTEKSYSSADREEAADIRRAQRAKAVKQQQAKDQAALAKIARDPKASTADRNEAREIQQKHALANAPAKPKPAAKPPAPEKKGFWDRYVADPIKKAGDELEQAATTVKETASDVGDWAERNKAAISEVGHTVLDVGGMIPVVGAVADGINAGWYAAEGDYTNAGLSLAGMVPGVGDAATAAKLAAKGAKYAKNADKVAGAAQKGINAGERAYEAYGAVQEAQGVVEGVGDAYSELAKGNYGNAAMALGQMGLSVAGVRDGAKAAGGRGGNPKRSPDSDRTPISGDRPSALSNGSNLAHPKVVGTSAGATKQPPSKSPLQTKNQSIGAGSPSRKPTATGEPNLNRPDSSKDLSSGSSDDLEKSSPSLSTDRLRIQTNGIDRVEQHLSRFGSDSQNAKQIQRLRDIAAGKIVPTQKDLNFYAHELRESVEYRKLGYENRKTGKVWQPANKDEANRVWNATHEKALDKYGHTGDELYHSSTHTGNAVDRPLGARGPSSSGGSRSRTPWYKEPDPGSHYVTDEQGRTILAMTRVDGPNPGRKKANISRLVRPGMKPDDHRGHLGPENLVDKPRRVNNQFNIVAESPDSNLSAKKKLENLARDIKVANPNSRIFLASEPLYSGVGERPVAITHSIMNDRGEILHEETILNKNEPERHTPPNQGGTSFFRKQ